MKRFFYILTSRGNSRIENDSPYKVATGQVRANDMNHALAVTLARENITKEQNTLWEKPVFDFYRQGERVGVYISPVADDQ